MAKPPRVAGLILCQQTRVETSPPRYSLVGLIRGLAFSTWPAVAPPFYGYSSLQGGEGEGTIEVVVTRLETEEDVYRYQRWIGLLGSAEVTHAELPLRRCVFPAPGRYAFVLKFDGNHLTQRLLDVNAERGPS